MYQRTKQHLLSANTSRPKLALRNFDHLSACDRVINSLYSLNEECPLKKDIKQINSLYPLLLQECKNGDEKSRNGLFYPVKVEEGEVKKLMR
jgi:hypothetical protein